MEDNLVTIAEYNDYIEADLAKQLLEDFGIKAFAIGQNASNVYGGILPANSCKLQVLQSQAQEAKKILEERIEIEEQDEMKEQ